MGFWEFLTTLAVAVVLPLAIVHLILSYRREKLKLRQGPSLGARELQQLVRQAVEEAQQPLLTRIEALERQLRRCRRPVNRLLQKKRRPVNPDGTAISGLYSCDHCPYGRYSGPYRMGARPLSGPASFGDGGAGAHEAGAGTARRNGGATGRGPAGSPAGASGTSAIASVRCASTVIPPGGRTPGAARLIAGEACACPGYRK